MENTSLEALHHRLVFLEQARFNIESEIARLRDMQGGLEGRMIASETMQPVIVKALEEFKNELSKINSRMTGIGSAILIAFLGAVVTWVANGGLTMTPGVGN